MGVLLAAAPVLAGLIVPPNPDVSWLLFVAERLLDGARFGRDVIEINPPLIAWMNVPAVVIARAMGISPVEAYQAGVSLACAASAAWCARLLPRGHPAAENRAVAFAVGSFLLAWLPTSEFGQREHLAVILVVPYLLVVGRRLDGAGIHRWEAGAAGVIAGLGFALKPFFLLPFLFVEAGLAVVRRGARLRGRPEFTAILVVLATYPLMVLLVAPDYFNVVVRLWPAYREFYPVSLSEAIAHGVTRPWVGLAAVTLASLCWHFQRWGLELVVSLAVAGFGAAALVQQRAWLYLWLPLLILGWGLLVLLLARSRSTVTRRTGLIVRALAVFVVAGALGAYALRWNAIASQKIGWASKRESPYRQVRSFIERCASGETVVGLSPFHDTVFPAVPDGGGRWGLRYNALWPVSAAVPGIDGPGPLVHALPAEAGAAAHDVLKTTSEDLLRDPPRLILVPELDSTAQTRAGYQRLDFLAMLSADPGVAALLGGYVKIGRAGVFRVLLRGGRMSDLDCGSDR